LFMAEGSVFQAGQGFRRFTAKDGRGVTLRAPKWEDLDDLLDFINSLVNEGADILRDKKVTREEEANWLGSRLADIENDRMIGIVAEMDGRVVANSEVARKGGVMGHVGELGISVKAGFRDMGIGTEMMGALIEESRRMGLKVLVLDVFASNSRARHLYKKTGFEEAGKNSKGHLQKGRVHRPHHNDHDPLILPAPFRHPMEIMTFC